MAIYQSAHQVKRFEVKPIEKQDPGTYVRQIDIETEDGIRLEITLFSKTRAGLMARKEQAS